MNNLKTGAMEDQTLNLGLLMEAAHAQKALAEATLDRLNEHVRGLDAVVRGEIRRTLIDELETLCGDTKRASESLRSLIRAANLRTLAWSVGVTAFCSAIPLAEAWWTLPSQTEITALSAKRDQLVAHIAALERRGGRIDLRRCGTADRLCVRVDRKAPVYGETADYFVVQGY